MVDILSTLVDWHDWFPTPNFLDPGCGDGGTIPAEELKVVMLGLPRPRWYMRRTRNAVTRPLRAPNHRFSVCNVHIQGHLDIHKTLLSYLNVVKSSVV